MSKFEHHDQDEEDFGPSRTQIKREAEALQALGLELVELGEKHLVQVGLEGRLADAVYEARGMKHREGRRRQLQFIGKLMREEDHETIRANLEKVKNIGRQMSHTQQQAEVWQSRLLTEGNEALQAFISAYPSVEAQHLRQLIRNTLKEQSQKKAPTNAKKLFHQIRETLEDINN